MPKCAHVNIVKHFIGLWRGDYGSQAMPKNSKWCSIQMFGVAHPVSYKSIHGLIVQLLIGKNCEPLRPARLWAVQNLDIAVHSCTRTRKRCSIFLIHHLIFYTLPVVDIMSHSSNLIIGSTFNSAQGDFHIHSRDSESGMHNFMSVQKSILIDDPMKDFMT